jgi:Ser/Thr protein kinase RdoA (MazF antagonist)
MADDFGGTGWPALERAVSGALPAWSLPGETEVALLSVSENVTWLLHDPASGRRLVLRVHRPGYHREAEIRSELAWIEALRRDAGFPTPAPVAGSDGKVVQRIRVEPSQAELAVLAFNYVQGQEPARGTTTFRSLGALTARLHRHARTWPRPPGFRRKTWDAEAMLGGRAVWGDWRAAAGLDRAGLALLERTADFLRARLARLGAGADRFGLIHADLRLANLLAVGDALHVIDFDDCGFGWFAYDFAASVSFFEEDPAIPALFDAWLDGYRTVAPFARAAAAEIPSFVMLRRMLLLAWIASHPEAETAQALHDRFTPGTLALAEAFLTRYG